MTLYARWFRPDGDLSCKKHSPTESEPDNDDILRPNGLRCTSHSVIASALCERYSAVEAAKA